MIRAWTVFVAVATLLGGIFSCLHTWVWGSGLSVPGAAAALIVAAVFSGFLSSRHLRRWIATFWLRAHRVDQLLFLILFLGGALCILTLSFNVTGQWSTSNPDNLGDLPFHAHLTAAFAKGLRFPPMDPTFAGEPLHYAYGIDLWDALWVKLGIPLQTSFILTGWMALFVTLIALWRAGGTLLMASFFLSGGLVWGLHWQDSYGPGSQLAWKNLFHAVLMTQRGFLWALPAGLYLMRKWTRYLEDKTFRLPGSFIFLWAVMPFFHLHTFAILSLWIGLTALAKRRIPWNLAWGLPLALFFLAWSVNSHNVSSSLGWTWGWMLKDFGSVFRNFGPWLMLPIWLCARWIRNGKWDQLIIALFLTFVAINVKTAPWEWDQIKIILWMYLLWTFWAVREFRWQGYTAFALSCLLMWPGALQWVSGLPSMTQSFEVQNAVDRATVEKLLTDVPVDDVVAANVDTRHPLLGLGQSLAMGFAAHAWSHGLPSDQRQQQLNDLLQGHPEGVAAAQEMGVKWIVWQDNAEISDAIRKTWTDWGWSESKAEGTWHLWGKSR